ncbi:hypothetical protein C8R45DRAFT_1114186 [Mycena sanguinolenta]|nr:hypothetical protein C8R45DRAFT_1114186 [Mycena sanguinolenta]
MPSTLWPSSGRREQAPNAMTPDISGSVMNTATFPSYTRHQETQAANNINCQREATTRTRKELSVALLPAKFSPIASTRSAAVRPRRSTYYLLASRTSDSAAPLANLVTARDPRAWSAFAPTYVLAYSQLRKLIIILASSSGLLKSSSPISVALRRYLHRPSRRRERARQLRPGRSRSNPNAAGDARAVMDRSAITPQTKNYDTLAAAAVHAIRASGIQYVPICSPSHLVCPAQFVCPAQSLHTPAALPHRVCTAGVRSRRPMITSFTPRDAHSPARDAHQRASPWMRSAPMALNALVQNHADENPYLRTFALAGPVPNRSPTDTARMHKHSRIRRASMASDAALVSLNINLLHFGALVPVILDERDTQEFNAGFRHWACTPLDYCTAYFDQCFKAR